MYIFVFNAIFICGLDENLPHCKRYKLSTVKDKNVLFFFSLISHICHVLYWICLSEFSSQQKKCLLDFEKKKI